MLESIITAKNGDSYLNSLRRYCKSCLIVPTQANLVVNVPAMVGTERGVSPVIPMQGPEDAKSELYSLVGVQGVTNLGIGTVTCTGGDTNVTGSGTKFNAQLQVGATIVVGGNTGTIATVVSDTLATTTLAIPAAAAVAFFYSTPLVAAVRDRLCVTIQDAGWRRDLMNQPINVDHVFGDATKPMYLKEAPLLETDQTLLFKFYNYSATGPASIAIQSEARKWQVEALKRKNVNDFIEGLRKRKKFVNPYWLGLDDIYETLAASDSATAFLTNTADNTLILFNLYCKAITGGVTGDTQEIVSFEFFDPVTERALQVQPVTLNTACGNARNPFPLPTPLICEPGSQIKVKMTNLVTDATTVVFLSFHGVALYTGFTGRGGALMEPDIIAESKRMYAASAPQIVPASPAGR